MVKRQLSVASTPSPPEEYSHLYQTRPDKCYTITDARKDIASANQIATDNNEQLRREFEDLTEHVGLKSRDDARAILLCYKLLKRVDILETLVMALINPQGKKTTNEILDIMNNAK